MARSFNAHGSSSTRKKIVNLDILRENLGELASTANERASQLSPENQAIKEAVRTLPKSRRGSNELFSGNIRTIKEMRKEYARIQAFLSDWRTTEEGETFYNTEKYKGAFGGQWLKKYGETFDKSRVTEDLAIRAFQLYDRLVEEYQSEDRARMLWNKDSSLISYGSENMIIAIYDMLARDISDERVFEEARRRMDVNYLELQGMKQRSAQKFDYGQIDLDYLNSNMTRKEIIRELAKKHNS